MKVRGRVQARVRVRHMLKSPRCNCCINHLRVPSPMFISPCQPDIHEEKSTHGVVSAMFRSRPTVSRRDAVTRVYLCRRSFFDPIGHPTLIYPMNQSRRFPRPCRPKVCVVRQQRYFIYLIHTSTCNRHELLNAFRAFNTWPFSRRRRLALVGNLGRRPLPFNRLSFLSLTGFGIWTLSSSKPIKAESPSSAVLPNEQSPTSVQQTGRNAHTKSGNYTSNEPDHRIPGQQAPPPQSKVVEQKESDVTVRVK
jgi:hypothetical protein